MKKFKEISEQQYREMLSVGILAIATSSHDYLIPANYLLRALDGSRSIEDEQAWLAGWRPFKDRDDVGQLYNMSLAVIDDGEE